MFLSRLFLQPDDRGVRADLADPEQLHKSVMRLFPFHDSPTPRKAHGVLHRLDENAGGVLLLLVQSRVVPDVAALPRGYLADPLRNAELASLGIEENPAIRDVTAERRSIHAGDRFLFRLKANTTRKILTKSGPDGERRHGKRVPVRGDAERIQWLDRRAEQVGCTFSDLRVQELPAKGRNVRVAGTLFDGALQVKEPSRLIEALEAGVGPAKAYGFGLLSIRRFV